MVGKGRYSGSDRSNLLYKPIIRDQFASLVMAKDPESISGLQVTTQLKQEILRNLLLAFSLLG